LAIWLAESPSAHNFFNSSTRSSVHDMLCFLFQTATSEFFVRHVLPATTPRA
jgi:hypothetical protein